MIKYKMVLMNASKGARNQQSIVHRPTCGGNAKKSGLTPRIGYTLSSNPNMRGAVNTQFGLVCNPSRTIQTQNYGYRAVHSGNMG